MLPLLYTREFVLQKQRQKLTTDPATMIYTDSYQTLYTVQRMDTAARPQERGRIRFETRVESVDPSQKLLIGLLDTSALHMGPDSAGVVCSLDLEMGILTDLVNDQGVIGYAEAAPWTKGATLDLAIEMELFRNVCIPKILVAGQEILHPALIMPAYETLCGVMGVALGKTVAPEFTRGKVTVSETAALSA